MIRSNESYYNQRIDTLLRRTEIMFNILVKEGFVDEVKEEEYDFDFNKKKYKLKNKDTITSANI